MSDKNIQIVVLTNGFVHVGEVSVEDGWLIIRKAKNIRRWGTDSGLGQLALNGPQPQTVIDTIGTIRAPLDSVIFVIDCDQTKWIQRED